MCAAEEWCHIDDHPLARVLLESDRPARLLVVCHPKKHRLAAVYDLPASDNLSEVGLPHSGGLTVCLPGFTGLMDHYELADIVHGRDAKVHFHADVFPLDDDRLGNWAVRCRCHTYTVRREDLLAGLERPWGHTKYGVPFVYGNFSQNARDTRS